MRAFGLCLLAANIAGAPGTLVYGEEPADPWYAARAFPGHFGCLGLGKDQSLEAGDPLLVFSEEHDPVPARVASIVTASDENESDVTEEKRCSHNLRRDWERMARLAVDERLHHGSALAIKAPPAFLALGARFVETAGRETRGLLQTLDRALPPGFRKEGRLVSCRRYGGSRRPKVLECYVGLPTYNPGGVLPPIRSIRIRRLFVVEGGVLGQEEWTRVSGEEERVDSGAPELDEQNWARSDTENTIGFVSRDGGRTWDRLSLDVGFEGVWWIVTALREGLPRLYAKNLYTHH